MLCKLPQRSAERFRAQLEAVEALVQTHRVLADPKDSGPARQLAGQAVADEAHPCRADMQRPESGRVEVIAGAYVVEIGHGEQLVQIGVSVTGLAILCPACLDI